MLEGHFSFMMYYAIWFEWNNNYVTNTDVHHLDKCTCIPFTHPQLLQQKPRVLGCALASFKALVLASPARPQGWNFRHSL
jgi:hypothetical protein